MKLCQDAESAVLECTDGAGGPTHTRPVGKRLCHPQSTSCRLGNTRCVLLAFASTTATSRTCTSSRSWGGCCCSGPTAFLPIPAVLICPSESFSQPGQTSSHSMSSTAPGRNQALQISINPTLDHATQTLNPKPYTLDKSKTNCSYRERLETEATSPGAALHVCQAEAYEWP